MLREKDIVDEGIIGNKRNLNKFQMIESEVGEFVDVLAVAVGRKTLAALDLRGTLRKKNLNKKKIKEITKFAKEKGLQILTVKPSKMGWGSGGYLRSVVYRKANKKKAMKLLGVLWGCMKSQKPGCNGFGGWQFHVAIGLLLGYKRDNIREFVRRNYDMDTVKPSEFSKILMKMKKMKFYENETGFYNPVLKNTNVIIQSEF